MNFRPLHRLLGVCYLFVPILVACAKPTLPVSIHGVNYSAEVFSYVMVDPDNPKNTGGGELIDPFAAGGTLCCYELPREWHAGMKVTINTTHWLRKLADGSLREVEGRYSVEIPTYPQGKPGELWVLRAADGTMGLVSSDFQPDHPNWPGKFKGWPVPSLAYQRERWDLYINHQMGFIRGLEQLSRELDSDPDSAAKNEWEHSLEYDKKSLKGFDGPADARYRRRLKQEYEQGLKETWAEVKRLQKGRP